MSVLSVSSSWKLVFMVLTGTQGGSSAPRSTLQGNEGIPGGIRAEPGGSLSGWEKHGSQTKGRLCVHPGLPVWAQC